MYNAAGDQKTFPLLDASIAANNGDVDAAMEMYDEMQHSLDDAHSDAVVAYAGAVGNGAITHRFPPPPSGNVGLPGFGDGLWSTPVGGTCFPVPAFCQQWPGGLSNWGWGLYNQWWGSPMGAPPPTADPPRPDGCTRGDVDCIVWERNRQNACDELVLDRLAAYGTAAVAGGSCGSAIATAGGLTVACVGAFAAYAAAQGRTVKNDSTCHRPYPG